MIDKKFIFSLGIPRSLRFFSGDRHLHIKNHLFKSAVSHFVFKAERSDNEETTLNGFKKVLTEQASDYLLFLTQKSSFQQATPNAPLIRPGHVATAIMRPDGTPYPETCISARAGAPLFRGKNRIPGLHGSGLTHSVSLASQIPITQELGSAAKDMAWKCPATGRPSEIETHIFIIPRFYFLTKLLGVLSGIEDTKKNMPIYTLCTMLIRIEDIEKIEQPDHTRDYLRGLIYQANNLTANQERQPHLASNPGTAVIHPSACTSAVLRAFTGITIHGDMTTQKAVVLAIIALIDDPEFKYFAEKIGFLDSPSPPSDITTPTPQFRM
jgi:hypothetical protein